MWKNQFTFLTKKKKKTVYIAHKAFLYLSEKFFVKLPANMP